MASERRRAGETWRCKCGTELIGARTKTGKVVPITYNTQYEGNVLIFRAAGGVLECRTFGGEVLAKLHEETVPLRKNHSADCIHAAEFVPKGAT